MTSSGGDADDVLHGHPDPGGEEFLVADHRQRLLGEADTAHGNAGQQRQGLLPASSIIRTAATMRDSFFREAPELLEGVTRTENPAISLRAAGGRPFASDHRARQGSSASSATDPAATGWPRKVADAIRIWDREYRGREATSEIRPLDAPAIDQRPRPLRRYVLELDRVVPGGDRAGPSGLDGRLPVWRRVCGHCPSSTPLRGHCRDA